MPESRVRRAEGHDRHGARRRPNRAVRRGERRRREEWHRRDTTRPSGGRINVLNGMDGDTGQCSGSDTSGGAGGEPPFSTQSFWASFFWCRRRTRRNTLRTAPLFATCRLRCASCWPCKTIETSPPAALIGWRRAVSGGRRRQVPAGPRRQFHPEPRFDNVADRPADGLQARRVPPSDAADSERRAHPLERVEQRHE